MCWYASTYGMDSFMNRLPAMFTMIEPGELRSERANHAPPTGGTSMTASPDTRRRDPRAWISARILMR
jgi:hypothetical protein